MPNPVFEPQASVFSLPNAQLLGQAAAVSYEDRSACEAWSASRGFHFLDQAGTQGFLAQSDQVLLVAFRGAQPDPPVNWLSDAYASRETWGHPVGAVHKASYAALREIWNEEALPKRLLDRGDRALWIAGHGLGGALAQLCAAEAFFVRHIPVQGVYTFGQPRVGDEAFARLVHANLGSRIFRFVNGGDIVPRVPLFGMGYRHFGAEIFFDHEHARHDLPAAVESLPAALRFAGRAFNFDPIVEAGKLFAESVSKAGLLGDHHETLFELVRQREMQALGGFPVQDHDMRSCYLARLGE
jgi:triacylglycerol lipase